MGYMHIDNLYKNTNIMLFNECYALEKIHGTSANVTWKDNEIRFHSGGEKHSKFVDYFDQEALETKFKELFAGTTVTLFGEAYGGKQQGMSKTYGETMKFVVFDVKIDGTWLDVPNAEDVTEKIGLEFVAYNKVSTELESLNKERDLPSRQAKRNGIEEDKMAEGVVLRPLIEAVKSNGKRIIVKHKRDEFMETATKREVNPEKLLILTEAKAIADEWVTPMRLSHVLDKLGNPDSIEKTGDVVKAMVSDVIREAKDEIVISKALPSAIGKKASELYRKHISKI